MSHMIRLIFTTHLILFVLNLDNRLLPLFKKSFTFDKFLLKAKESKLK